MWKRRLQNKIKELRKDLSQSQASKDKYISNFRHWERLERKYSIRVKRLNVVTEELKQDYCYCSKSQKVSGTGRQLQTQQTIWKKIKGSQFYRQKDLIDQEQERCDDDQPATEEWKHFSGNIWSQSGDHKKDPKWLQDLRI